MKTQTCSICHEEVRYGVREGVRGWLHRESVDHAPIFGVAWTAADQQRASEAIATRLAEARTTKSESDEDDEPAWVGDEIPEPEVECHAIEVADLRPRSGILGIANLILGKNKDKVQGWSLRRLTHTRGPYVGARGQVLSIDDFIVLGAAGPDGRVAVAGWRNYAFDFGYAGVIDAEEKKVRTFPVNSTEMRAWIKDGLTSVCP